MTDEKDNTAIPDWLLKWGLGLVQAVLVPVVFATIAWSWNAEKRVSYLEIQNTAQVAALAEAKTKLESVQQNNTEIALLKLELGYIKSGISEIKQLLARPQ